MAEGQSPESISAEAFNRVKGENDSLKAQVEQAKAALKDSGIERRAAEYFGGKGYPNPLAVANRALSSLRDASDEEFQGKADAWYEEQRKLFAPISEPVKVESQPKSPWETAAPVPIPSGGRVQGTGEPLVTGSPQFVQWAKGKTLGDVQAAINSGDVVVPDKVKQAQNTIF